MLSLAMAGGAALVANNWLANQQPTLAADDRVPVVLAAVDIPYGQKIESHHVKLVHLDPKGVPPGAVTQIEEVEGKVASQEMLSDEIVHAKRITAHLEGSTLASLIEPNMRAVTVRVDDVIGVAGFLLPGNRVDILASRKVKQRVVSETVLKDIKVLAIDQKARNDQDDPVIVRAVTLEVTPQHAEVLMKAKEEGRIQLALRNPLDEEIAVVTKPAPAPKAKPRPRVPHVHPSSVTVIRGVEVNKSKVSL
ncbi:Flp pilus assembly protein CpaB [Motiliproteus sp. SC1-56]|uniref:Flp pilus assembly protein CpaB n=1 Tax=Motiliproteus sp. SC1-56 TaxID=2799565 RepID=UPI00351CA34F